MAKKSTPSAEIEVSEGFADESETEAAIADNDARLAACEESFNVLLRIVKHNCDVGLLQLPPDA